MQAEYKILTRDGGEAVTLYDSETEEIIATVTVGEYKAYSKIAYAICEYAKLKMEAVGEGHY